MESVIACIDGSSSSGSVCDAAAWASVKLGRPLILLHTLEKPAVPTTDNLSGTIGLGAQEQLLHELVLLDEQRSKLALQHGSNMLAEAKELAIADGATEVSVKQRHGDVLEALRDLEDELRIVVMGRCGEGHEIGSKAVGSHIESVARAINKPLLITVDRFNEPSNFMIAYDGRETADRAIERIIASELLRGLECHLVMVGAENDPKREKLDRANELLRSKGFSVNSHYLVGDIFPELERYKKENEIELLVMGAYAHSRVRQFFVGSNTTRMIAEATTPLIIIK